MAIPDIATRRHGQPIGKLLVYALAQAGGVIAYAPFLMFILPAQVAALAGRDQVEWLSYIVFGGAIAASIAGIAFGGLSDATQRRRRWVGAGLISSILLLLVSTRCRDPGSLLGVMLLWQVSLNMMLTPLLAWAGDIVPDDQKGLLGGLLALAPLAGAGSAMVVTLSGVRSLTGQILLISGMMVTALLPALLILEERPPAQSPRPAGAQPARDWVQVRMWIGRLLVQISGVALASYLYFWFRSVDPAMRQGEMSALYTAGLAGAIVLALALGHWADRRGRPFAILVPLALLVAASLAAMSAATTPLAAKLGYMLFAVTSTAFLALHAGQTLRVLPDPRRRGLALGIFNLTNTAPSLMTPWLALLLVPSSGYGALLLILAALALCAALFVAIPRRA